MAAVEPSTTRHGPKLRSRQHGAAIPLDELDKRLLNLMQGSFPIAGRPYQHVAVEAGISEHDALARVQRLINERIIRQVCEDDKHIRFQVTKEAKTGDRFE